MKIAVNTRLLLKGRLEGIGWFSYETLKRITIQHPEHTFIFIFDRPFDDSFIFGDNVQGISIPPPTRHPFLWYIWFEYSLPRALRRIGADMLFSPDGYIPLKSNIPVLTAIHDINFHHRPFDLPLLSRIYYRKYFPLFARIADRIVTVSEYSRNDISESYKINPDKIDVVYNGANEVYSPITHEKIKETRQSITGGDPYFIFIGSMHPRKNVGRLLQAFDSFRSGYLFPFRLVIVGEKMFKTSGIDKIYRSMAHKNDVIFSDRLQPEELHAILGASEGLTYVPHYEGFGIPLLEAMHCEIPILASNVTSLPEIAGKAALYADPENVLSIAEGMMKLATNEKLRMSLIEKGRSRRTAFSWDATAQKLWYSMEKIMK